MTVRDLIEKLQQFEQDSKVFSDYLSEGFTEVYKFARDAGNGKVEWWVRVV